MSVFYIHDELFSTVIFKRLVNWQEQSAKMFNYICDLCMHPEFASSNVRLILVFSQQYFIVQNKETLYNKRTS